MSTNTWRKTKKLLKKFEAYPRDIHSRDTPFLTRKNKLKNRKRFK